MKAVLGSITPLKGILCLVLGGALMTASDSVLKWLTSDYPVGQIMFLRGIFGLIPILIFVRQAGGVDALITRNYGYHILRSSLMVGGTFLYVTGLRFLPLADTISIAFAGPLFITALASPVLGERVGWRRWIGVLIGYFDNLSARKCRISMDSIVSSSGEFYRRPPRYPDA